MYLFPALTCEPVIGSLEAFTKGILRVFEAVLTEPETEINTGRLATEASAVCLTSKTITPSLGNLHQIEMYCNYSDICITLVSNT